MPRLPDEPYALAVDEGLQLMYVGHLRGGGISLMDLGTGLESRTPELVQTFNNLLPADGNGSQGATIFAGNALPEGARPIAQVATLPPAIVSTTAAAAVA